MGKKAIIAGHLCIDITPVMSGRAIQKISELFIPGRTITTGDAVVNTGGAVANTGLAMKIFGADVKLIGKVGTDALGSMVCSVLKKYNADQDVMFSDEAGSSYTIALSPPGIDRIFLHCPGLNDTFRSSDVSDEAMEDAALLHFGYPSLMRQMYINEGAELVDLFRRAKEKGLLTSLDFSAIDPESEAGAVDWRSILKKVIPYVDFFVPSLDELGYMMNKELRDEWIRRADGRSIDEVITVENDVKPLADELLSWGAKAILIKCGAPGMYYRCASAEVMQEICEKLSLDIQQWSDLEGFEHSFVPECVRSATGAGDTSIGAFLTSALRGYGMEESVRMATAAGAACVEAYDALSGLCSFEQLQERAASGWEKSKVSV